MSSPSASPCFVSADEVHGKTLSNGAHLLAVIGFCAPRPPALDPACPFVEIGMRQLAPGAAYEAWVCAQPPSWHSDDGVRYALTGDTLFAIIEPDESQFAGLQDLAYAVYRDLFALADRLGRPHVLRVFNYLPRITEMEHGMERYRAFNAGRHAAFDSSRRAIPTAPAACALGTRSGQPKIYFVASVSPGRAVENPRQERAYHYPARYGPRSPSFSRAMLHGQGRHLFISGTASIIGHESVHLGDAGAQTDETLRNLGALLRGCGCEWADIADSVWMKVYIRHVADLELIREHLSVLPRLAGTMLVAADICRPELLVEIEGFCELGK